MKAMTKHRSHSAAFKRQVAQEFIAGETLHGLSKRHDISRQLIRIWVGKFESGALDEDVQAADLLQEYEAKIAALERMVGRQALEIETLSRDSRLGQRNDRPLAVQVFDRLVNELLPAIRRSSKRRLLWKRCAAN